MKNEAQGDSVLSRVSTQLRALENDRLVTAREDATSHDILDASVETADDEQRFPLPEPAPAAAPVAAAGDVGANEHRLRVAPGQRANFGRMHPDERVGCGA